MARFLKPKDSPADLLLEGRRLSLCLCEDRKPELPEESLLVGFLDMALFDTRLFAGEVAQIVEFCATHFTKFVDSDGFDEGRLDGENTLHADSVGNLAHSETLFVLMAADADHYTAILLDTLLDTVSDSDSVAGAEFFEFFLGSSESFLRNFD